MANSIRIQSTVVKRIPDNYNIIVDLAVLMAFIPLILFSLLFHSGTFRVLLFMACSILVFIVICKCFVYTSFDFMNISIISATRSHHCTRFYFHFVLRCRFQKMSASRFNEERVSKCASPKSGKVSRPCEKKCAYKIVVGIIVPSFEHDPC